MEGFLTRNAAGRLVVYGLTAKEVETVFFLREVLEGYGAPLAADRASDEEMDRLDSVHSADFQASKRDQVQAMSSLNEECQRLIQPASRNRVLADLSFDLGSRIPRIARLCHRYPAQNRMFVEEDADILRLIREREGKPDARSASSLARDLMLTHIGEPPAR
jgi:DNA-binding GntR family transcriptional regulator